jgi:hypothetical protein
MVLATAPWSFATKRQTLALLADVERVGWRYVYALPADFVTVQAITVPGAVDPSPAQQAPYSLEADEVTGKTVLATDVAAAELVYTGMPSNATVYGPLVENALAWAIASDLAMGLSNKVQLADWAYRRFLQSLSAAMASDLNQQRAAPSVSAFERARS